MKRNLFYLTYMAVLVTFAVVIHTVEAALPLPMPVPGVRLGLANIITLLAIVLYGLRSGLLVSVLRTLIGSFFTGGFLGFGFWLSLAGGAAACLVMTLAVVLLRRGYLSLVSVSILGAVTHNLAQLAAASVIIANPALLRGYFPLLLLLGIPTGLFTGLAAHYLEGITRRIICQAGGVGAAS
ncbi:MAG: Gx transporter family protein [Bacillota bacterium]